MNPLNMWFWYSVLAGFILCLYLLVAGLNDLYKKLYKKGQYMEDFEWNLKDIKNRVEKIKNTVLKMAKISTQPLDS